MTKEKRYIKKSDLEKMSTPEWLRLLKTSETVEYIMTDDDGNVITDESIIKQE